MAARPKADFAPYEKMPEDTNCWQSKKLGSIRKWVALEKVHGANFSFTVTAGGPVRVAKRGGYLGRGENFFGVQRQLGFIEGEEEKARRLYAAVAEMHSDVTAVTIYGELFGGYYPHSTVPVCPGVIPVQTEVVYCPDLKFITYDIAICQPSGRRYLDYDVCMQLFKNSGLLYAEPLCTGSLRDMLSYPLGFPTKLPVKFGLPPLEGRSNTAEGIVIKPLKSVLLETSKGPRRVIFKRKVENFMEKKQRSRMQPSHKGAKQHAEYQPEFELLKYEMYALVTEQRVVNTISKHGLPTTESEWEDIVESLFADVLEDLSSENEDLWTKCQQQAALFAELMQEAREQSAQAVEQYREKL